MMKKKTIRGILNIMVGINPDHDSSEDIDINQAEQEIKALMDKKETYKIIDERLPNYPYGAGLGGHPDLGREGFINRLSDALKQWWEER